MLVAVGCLDASSAAALLNIGRRSIVAFASHTNSDRAPASPNFSVVGLDRRHWRRHADAAYVDPDNGRRSRCSAVPKPDLQPWVKFPDRSSIVRAEQLPWTPWAMPGTRFKLLYINRAIQMTVVLLDVEPNTEASVHKHFGDAHAYVLKGGFGYEHGEVFEGDYMVEAGGIMHTPKTGADGVCCSA